MRNLHRSMAALAALAFVAAVGNNAQQASKDAPIAVPYTSVPTFSTANIARQGHFYVGGKWVGEPGKEVMRAGKSII